MGNFVGLSVEKMESELQFSIFFRGCKQSKSIHFFFGYKDKTSILKKHRNDC